METGNYFPFQEMKEEANQRGIPIVKAWTPQQLGIDSTSTTQDFAEFTKKVKSTIGVEGFVIRFEDGDMFKIKTTWYFGLNNSLDHIKNGIERYKWEAILGETYDDLRPFLRDVERESIDAFAKDLLQNINKTAQRLVNEVEPLKKIMSRKDFSSIVLKAPKSERNVLWYVWSELEKMETNTDNETNINLQSEVTQFISKVILNSLGQKKSFEEVQSLVGGISFENYRNYDPKTFTYAEDDN